MLAMTQLHDIRRLFFSEFDVLVKFLDNPEDQTSWMWDENSCQFIRRSDTE